LCESSEPLAHRGATLEQTLVAAGRAGSTPRSSAATSSDRVLAAAQAIARQICRLDVA
jgi:hypothetical protein